MASLNSVSRWDEIVDVLICGYGCAGASAAIYAARKGIRTGLLAERFGGHMVAQEPVINGYLGSVALMVEELNRRAEALRTAMLERFARGGSGGSAGSSAPDGSGLGLSIAQDIAHLHGSALELGRSDLGGLRVRLSFAAAQA